MISKRCAALLLSFAITVDLIWRHSVVGHLGITGDINRTTTPINTIINNSSTSSPSVAPMTSFLLDEPQRDMEDTSDACFDFKYGDMEKQTFTSPGYPERYPSNIECFRVLEAPSGQVIHLDFREQFNLEGDQCKNDFLEIHDGAHGFNKPIGGPYCGTQFPPMIFSSDRHLWLHFKSDDTVEHSGFKAVYQFVNRSEDAKTPEIRPCNISISGEHQGRLNKSNIDNETLLFNKINKMPIDCIWEITADEGWKVQLSFKKFKLDRPNDCEANFVDVFSSSTDIPSREKHFCGSIADTVNSKGRVMYIRFFASPEASEGSNFEALFTAFRENEKNADCRPDEFNCDDATCISETLKCNGEYNCRFRWDEDECNKRDNFPVGENHIIIIMVIFSLILSGMCFTFLFNCVKKLIRDHRTIQEYLRQSREHQLNELGKQEQIEKKIAKLGRSRSNSTQSSDSQRYPTANAMVNTPCYVPGELLPIIIRNERNGGSGAVNGEAYQTTAATQFDEDDHQQQQQQPEMCDSACQTRESLFHPYGSEHSTPNHSVASANSKPSPPAPFSTFGYKKEGKYRAEAKIEIEKSRSEEKRRPYSVQTTKSAPDVIVTH
ncbi:uncharacterized protein [Onthophagus taurus]|uniref:uncharacterized protein isoform X2 n=1 Tax=Onthophagus taurus TaxID=166361 RepID=UPI0039BEC735